MVSPIISQSQSLLSPGRKSTRSEKDKGPDKKPKKVNSEIRKQQNRMASRNYREKRKQKLQYLQQLMKDGSSSDQQASTTSPHSFESVTRSPSAEYEVSVPRSSPFVLPSNDDFESLASDSRNEFDPLMVATTTTFDSQLLATTQSYSNFEPSWHAPIYGPSPPMGMPWWTLNIDLPSRMTSPPQIIHYAPSPDQSVYNRISAPSQQPQQLFLNPDPSSYTSNSPCRFYDEPPHQTSNIASYYLHQQPLAFDRLVYT